MNKKLTIQRTYEVAMPKRTAQDKIDYYSAKLKKLEEKQSKSRRVVIYSDSSDDETTHNADNDNADPDELPVEVIIVQSDEAVTESLPTEAPPAEEPIDAAPDQPPTDAGATTEPAKELDAEYLSALGDPEDEEPGYGENIHPDLAERWLPIIRRGIPKDSKEKLLKEYAIPENCKLLRAPALNTEILGAITEVARNRDKKIETTQQQLGHGLTAVNRAMSILITGDDKQSKVQAIKMLSDGCRILSDLHHLQTQTRIRYLTQKTASTHYYMSKRH